MLSRTQVDYFVVLPFIVVVFLFWNVDTVAPFLLDCFALTVVQSSLTWPLSRILRAALGRLTVADDEALAEHSTLLSPTFVILAIGMHLGTVHTSWPSFVFLLAMARCRVVASRRVAMWYALDKWARRRLLGFQAGLCAVSLLAAAFWVSVDAPLLSQMYLHVEGAACAVVCAADVLYTVAVSSQRVDDEVAHILLSCCKFALYVALTIATALQWGDQDVQGLAWWVQLLLLRRLWAALATVNSLRRFFGVLVGLPDVANAEGTCIICLDAFAPPARVKRLRCGHEFHARCLRQWLTTSHQCPVCRAPAFARTQPVQAPQGQPPQAQPQEVVAAVPEVAEVEEVRDVSMPRAEPPRRGRGPFDGIPVGSAGRRFGSRTRRRARPLPAGEAAPE